MLSAREIAGLSPVIPVITPPEPRDMVQLAKAIYDGGIRTVEITLRTPEALAAIRAVRADVPELLVGAGTVLDPAQLDAALEAGAQFIVTPGLTTRLRSALLAAPVPTIPGVATVGEAMQARDDGFTTLKFFPAAGRLSLLEAFAAPLPDLAFCPTGGIAHESATEWLSLRNVVCVGGSWLSPQLLVEARDWKQIRGLAAGASQLGRPRPVQP